MAEQLKDLIEKIQDEGIRAAEGKAREIMAKAQSEATGIIQKARKEAQGMISGAEEEAARRQETTTSSLKQAGRDFMLKLRQEIKDTLRRLILTDVRGGLSAEEMTKIIAKLIEGYEESGSKIIITVSESDLAKVKKLLAAKLKSQLKKGLAIRGADEISGGFVISYDDNKSHFDFTDKALTEYLAANLEPDLQEILKDAAPKKGK